MSSKKSPSAHAPWADSIRCPGLAVELRVVDILTNAHSSHVATLDPNFQESRKKTFISRLIP